MDAKQVMYLTRFKKLIKFRKGKVSWKKYYYILRMIFYNIKKNLNVSNYSLAKYVSI